MYAIWPSESVGAKEPDEKTDESENKRLQNNLKFEKERKREREILVVYVSGCWLVKHRHHLKNNSNNNK